MIATAGTNQPSPAPSAADTPAAQSGSDQASSAPSQSGTAQGGTAGAEGAHSPSAEEVAERVYRLFCQDLRQMRERQGRW